MEKQSTTHVAFDMHQDSIIAWLLPGTTAAVRTIPHERKASSASCATCCLTAPRKPAMRRDGVDLRVHDGPKPAPTLGTISTISVGSGGLQ